MQTVLITGARSGLGLSLSRAFLAHGWYIVAVGRNISETPDDVRTNPNTLLKEVELTDDASLRALAADLRDTPVDILINNAGIYDTSSVDDDGVVSTLNNITRVFAVNAAAPRLLADLLLPNLELGSERLLVGISSGMGTFAQLFGHDFETTSRGTSGYEATHWVYSASKTALNYGLLSFGVLHPTVKVSLINPGWMQTAIGGLGAPLSPDDCAAAIVELLLNHRARLPASRLVNHLGHVMEL